jgi:hypothetical protein
MLNIFVLILGFGYASCMFLIYESKCALNLTLQYVIRPYGSTQVCTENLLLMLHIYRYSWEVAFALQSVSKVIGIGKPEFEQFKVINKIQNCFKKVYRLCQLICDKLLILLFRTHSIFSSLHFPNSIMIVITSINDLRKCCHISVL